DPGQRALLIGLEPLRLWRRPPPRGKEVVMSSQSVELGTLTIKVPSRFDRLPWSRFHWRVVVGLGGVGVVDGLEVTLVGKVVVMSSQRVELGTLTIKVPSRFDRLPWSRFRWRVVLGLGGVWVLDGLEVTMVGNVASRPTEAGSRIELARAVRHVPYFTAI